MICLSEPDQQKEDKLSKKRCILSEIYTNYKGISVVYF